MPALLFRVDSIQICSSNKYEYYGVNLSVSIEGIPLEHFSASNQESSSLTYEAVSRQTMFHYFLSNDRIQYDATTTEHCKHIMELLHNRKVLMTNKGTI